MVWQKIFPEVSLLHLRRPRVSFNYLPHLDTCAAYQRWRLHPPQDAWSRWSTPGGRPPPAVPDPALVSSAVACTGKDTVRHPATRHTHITKPSSVWSDIQQLVTHTLQSLQLYGQTSSNSSRTHYKAFSCSLHIRQFASVKHPATHNAHIMKQVPNLTSIF